jgi:polo-like kinase 1
MPPSLTAHSLLLADPLPTCWISKWVDRSDKYGLGFQMTDFTTGAYFNDSTSALLHPDQM